MTKKWRPYCLSGTEWQMVWQLACHEAWRRRDAELPPAMPGEQHAHLPMCADELDGAVKEAILLLFEYRNEVTPKHARRRIVGTPRFRVRYLDGEYVVETCFDSEPES